MNMQYTSPHDLTPRQAVLVTLTALALQVRAQSTLSPRTVRAGQFRARGTRVGCGSAANTHMRYVTRPIDRCRQHATCSRAATRAGALARRCGRRSFGSLRRWARRQEWAQWQWQGAQGARGGRGGRCTGGRCRVGGAAPSRVTLGLEAQPHGALAALGRLLSPGFLGLLALLARCLPARPTGARQHELQVLKV